ncbi:uncharacterized protein TRIADDRAFT_53672 [Trichoplax adhaerens]|uniref:Uncharacterized protein n=1 Tax=Trichoplax adhaerens TaxID=10228 RepID=B3RPV0_TRIAD|nr:hypothetical protein TRIADDRAFT_53672 [Trichoplax adhaerens]EDV27704.1 hypothetical protein TRIADDRAFT_53672 [Trichoplax adhaerens]|eukprot:XP_002109538.1 hypothetical protein TRIADDRAFT_53672 [Trichoplax adhaerens]
MLPEVNRNASDNTSRKNGDHGDAVLTDNSSAKLNRNFNEYAKKSKKIISLEGTGDSNYNGQNSQDDSRENQSSTTRKRKRSLAAAEVQELNITNNFNSKILKKLTAVDDDAIISPSIKKAKKATADDDTVSIENPRAKQFKKLKKEDELVESSKIIIKSKKFKMKNLKAAESGITASFTSSNSKMPETAKLEGNKLIKSASHKPKKISIGIENIEKDKSSDLYSDSEEKSKKSTKNRLRLTGNKTKASKNADLNVTSDTFETLKETDNKKSKAKLKKRCKVDAIKVEGNTSTTIDASPSIAISEGLKVRNQEKHTLTKVTKMDTPKSLDAKAKADILKPSKKRKAKGDIKSMAALSESNEDSIEKGDGNQQKKSLKLKKAKMHAKNSTTSSSVTNSNRSTNKEDRHAIDALLSARSGVIAIKKQHSEKLKKDKVVFDPNFLTESDKIGTGGIIKWD